MFRSVLRSPAIAGVAALTIAAPAGARDVRTHGLILSAAWARPTPPAAPAGAGYLTIVNKGSRPDRLLAGSSPVVRDVQVHEMRIVDGIARMHPVEGGLVIPAGGTVTLAPGGFHIMLIGPKHPLKTGEHVPVTLRFERAGAVKVSFDVRSTPPADGEAR